MNERLMIEQEEGWTRKIKSRKCNAKLVPCLAAILAVIFITSSFGFVWADTGADNSSVSIKATDAIKNDPAAMKVLQNIELFKQRWAMQQKVQELQDAQNKILDGQRALANTYLQNDVERMSNSKDQSTQNVFTNFLSTVNTPAQGVFLDEFSFMQERIQQARDSMKQVLQNGGTMDDARNAFNDAASFHKDQLVSVNTKLNIKYNLADQKVQSLFDKWGNIPRN